MLRDAWTIYRKELRDTLRDRRTLVFMLLLPIVMVPVLGSAVTHFFREAEQKAASSTLSYAVVGEVEGARALSSALVRTEGMEAVALEDDPDVAVADGNADFVLVVSEGEADQYVAELHYDNARIMQSVPERVNAVVEQVNDGLRNARLDALGVDTPQRRRALLEPIAVEVRGTASKRERIGEAMGGMLPYLFIVFCFLGALYPAIDLGAGEKERGTLETLLLAPVSRAAIVVGKFAVVFTTGLTSALLGTLSLGGWMLVEGRAQAGALGEAFATITPVDLGLVAALVVPVAAVLAAALLGISVYARSFKEAQSYMAPLNIGIALPAMVGLLPGIELDWRWAMVPVSNVALAIKEIVKGTVDPLMVGLIFTSTFVLAAAMLAACVAWFRRETVLFR